MQDSFVDMVKMDKEEKVEELKKTIEELTMKVDEMEKEKNSLLRAKDAEISVLRKRQPLKQFGFLSEVKIDCKIRLSSINRDGVLTERLSLGGMPFYGRASTSEDGKFLSLDVLFNNDSTSKTWRAGIDYAVGILSGETRWNRIKWEDDVIFDHAKTRKGFSDFMEWHTVTDIGWKFIDNGDITLHFAAKLISFESDAVTDFSLSTDVTDVTLLIEGTAIHASKAYLAACSTYFKALFISDSATFTLELPKFPENLQAEHFEEMLRIIYPERKEVTKDNVEFLLALANFFDVDVVRKECEAFLEKSEDFSSAKKVLLAEKYRLHHLSYSTARHLDNVDRVKEVVEAMEFNELSDSIKSGILKKFYELKK